MTRERGKIMYVGRSRSGHMYGNGNMYGSLTSLLTSNVSVSAGKVGQCRATGHGVGSTYLMKDRSRVSGAKRNLRGRLRACVHLRNANARNCTQVDTATFRINQFLRSF